MVAVYIGNFDDRSYVRRNDARASIFLRVLDGVPQLVQFTSVTAAFRSSRYIRRDVFRNFTNAHKSINGILHIDNCFRTGILHLAVTGENNLIDVI